MFDSIDPSQIPAGQNDAGYVDGRWKTFSVLHGPHNLSVAVFASDDADALDDEPGDATNAQAPGWVRRELALGHWRPCVYTSVSNAAALLAALDDAGVSRTQIRLWTAHYTYRQHICTEACGLPAGVIADATQWTDHSGGRNLDESTVTDTFFEPAPTPPVPTPALSALERDMRLVADGTGSTAKIWLISADWSKKHHVTANSSQWAGALGQTVIPVDAALVASITVSV